ncbi:MAG TPA: U32 family peptidase [Burkholderiaceae bacterium]|nr:U32 family peptidase [Burkholderiaceae bacterium]
MLASPARPDRLELLAPARDAAIGIEAVNHGADAVYIGAPAFGARASAGNSVADIERLAAHAHRFGAHIFVTLNTILRDDELEDARHLAWQVYEAGADALIIQDMGLLELDLPPIQLHGSTQCDIRSPEKARFLQDAGLSQIVLARELTLEQIAQVRAAIDPARCTLEFFVHGALCVAYSGLCNISHAHTGRSANRGDCSQACRLPYHVMDSQGRFVAHDQHVLSMKDNNQSDNLAALIDAGIRSFKIEGRYKDMGYVKNITGHYRRLLDEFLAKRPGFARASSGTTHLAFTPDPNQNFNREFTDYFVNGRQDSIGAFDSPKNPGQTIGWVTHVDAKGFEIETEDPALVLHNGDGLCYFDAQKQLVGAAINTAQKLPEPGLWRLGPKDAMRDLPDLRKGTPINRNRDQSWARLMAGKSSERRVAVDLRLDRTDDGFALTLTSEDGVHACARAACAHEAPRQDAQAAAQAVREHLGKLGNTIYAARQVELAWDAPCFIPASTLNALRRDAVAALDAARQAALPRLPRARPVEPPAPYPEDTLSYLANVHNAKARDFYARHGVRVLAAAYESHEELGEVSLMVTKHCVRYSMSLCPKQAKGVVGVQGQVRAEPLTLINGKEKLTLRFDCKPCEMHVVGRIKPGVLRERSRAERDALAQGVPMRFYKAAPSRKDDQRSPA